MPILVNGAGNTQPMPEGPNNKPTENKTNEEIALSVFEAVKGQANVVENLAKEITKESAKDLAAVFASLTSPGAVIKRTLEKMDNDLRLANDLFNGLGEAAKNTINKVKDAAEKAFEDSKQMVKNLMDPAKTEQTE